MSGRAASILFVFALVAALGVWWFVRTDDAAPPIAAEPRSAAAASEPVTAAAAPITAPPPAGAGTEAPRAERTADAPPPAAPAAKNATIRGRCVNEKGEPVAGCTVKVNGWTGNQSRMEVWLRDHRTKPEWKDVERTTAADGRFELEFWPPPPFQFVLDAAHAESVSMSARWPEIAEGSTRDVGDVRMQRGVQVEGRVVDESGAPVAKVSLRLVHGTNAQAWSGNGPNMEPVGSGWATSDADGRFRCDRWLPPGPFVVDLSDGRELAKPFSGTLDLARPVEVITVTVRAVVAVTTIRGKVVDAAGQPIASARVEIRDTYASATAMSRRDGTFELRSRVEASQPVTLFASHTEHEPTRSPAPVAWGTDDVVLTMQRGGDLAVCAFDEAQRPLTDFTVRVLPRDTGRFSSTDAEIRARGPFADGFATVAGIGRGKWTVVVEFPSQERRTTALTPIEVTALGTTRVDVLAPRDVARSVRVVSAAGTPVAGSKVQLCMPLGETFDDRSSVVGMDQFWWSSGDKALRLGEAITDADGRVTLAGPPDRRVAVCALGPGHVPARVWPLQWTPEPELVVTVAKGARLHGRVGPPQALAEMQRLAGDQADSTKRGIQLMRGSGRETQQLPLPAESDRFAIDASGAFSIEGLPPGEWRIAVTYHQKMQQMAIGKSLPVGVVVLRDGETTEFEADAAALLPGTLAGTLSKNGARCADCDVQLQGWMPGQTEKYATESVSIKTDAEGHFTTEVRPGTWRVRLAQKSSDGRWSSWQSAESATVVVGRTTQQAFSVWTGSLTVTLREASGAAAAGVDLDVYIDGTDERLGMPRTDASGVSANEVASGTLRFRVLPKRLQSDAARQKLWQECREKNLQYDQFLAPLWLDLGTAVVGNTAPTVLELRLPAEWEK